MSCVHNYILTTSVFEEKAIASFNENMFEDIGQTFVQADQHAGGVRHLECSVFLFAGNYISPEVIADHLKGVEWRRPLQVQLFVQKQDDETFTEYSWNE